MEFIYFLSALGIAETIYLLGKKLKKKSPVCILGEECGKVLDSKYNKLLFIPNEAMGLVFYLSVIMLGIFQMEFLMKAGIFTAAIFSAILLYLQWRVLKAWCSWCVASAVAVFLMAVIIILSYFI